MDPKESFICLCITLANIDGDYDPKERELVNQIVKQYGFTEEEVEKVYRELKAVGPNKAFEFGVSAIMGACQLEPEMRENLLKAMDQIAMADGRINPDESKLIQTTKNMFGFISTQKMEWK